jgi:hypothetical protein
MKILEGEEKAKRTDEIKDPGSSEYTKHETYIWYINIICMYVIHPGILN